MLENKTHPAAIYIIYYYYFVRTFAAWHTSTQNIIPSQPHVSGLIFSFSITPNTGSLSRFCFISFQTFSMRFGHVPCPGHSTTEEITAPYVFLQLYGLSALLSWTHIQVWRLTCRSQDFLVVASATATLISAGTSIPSLGIACWLWWQW